MAELSYTLQHMICSAVTHQPLKERQVTTLHRMAPKTDLQVPMHPPEGMGHLRAVSRAVHRVPLRYQNRQSSLAGLRKRSCRQN
ncbi:hypothetical protein ABBQ38_012120 [Trebouxia sp. C0009 RCD-2024]